MKIEITSIINCSVQQLFDFHQDETNLPLITPPDTTVCIINQYINDRNQKILTLKVKRFFITTHWTIKIIKMDSPHLMIDKAIKSPFSSWEHHHIFKSISSNQSHLCDRIEFELPFGLLGKLIAPIITYDIKKMFAYRHKQTKQALE